MKKLLLICFLFVFTVSFAQRDKGIQKKNSAYTTISNVSASPNPFYSKTRINFVSNKIQIVEFSVKNLLGKKVYIESIDSKKGNNSLFFYRNNLQKGMYIYTLQTETEIVSKRLIIQ